MQLLACLLFSMMVAGSMGQAAPPPPPKFKISVYQGSLCGGTPIRSWTVEQNVKIDQTAAMCLEGTGFSLYSTVKGFFFPTPTTAYTCLTFSSNPATIEYVTGPTSTSKPSGTSSDTTVVLGQCIDVAAYTSKFFYAATVPPYKIKFELCGCSGVDCTSLLGCPAEPSSSPCFPSTALVEKSDATFIPMSDLKIGDVVRTGNNTFSPIYMFSHRFPEAVTEFVELYTEGKNNPLILSPGHFLYVKKSIDAKLLQITASSVVIGDLLETGNGRFMPVVIIRSKSNTGLFNPHTLDGDIVVENIRTTVYTDAIRPDLAHALLAPVRALYAMDVVFGENKKN